ncbi:acetyltransferase [Hydrogenovibrio kuenenii]|uniref:acetyltransferase n=1 Tax=Hydrogenovibrio kuenenii TaxID=63658 RepID=UPI0004647AD4|nr:acetyltransferase [Hydrogenovibrio kuenenii]
MKTPLLLIGGGGHCASVIDVIEATGDYEIVGIVEAPGSDEKSLLGYSVIGTDDNLQELLKSTPNCVITVGQIQHAIIRKSLFAKVKKLGGKLPTIISPLARVARSAVLNEGVVVMHHAIVNHFARIGDNTIINHKALVEHGSVIGRNCHISTNATINGDAQVGEGCFLGSGSVLIQGVRVAENSLIGAGAVVTHHLSKPGVYVGCPAVLKKSRVDYRDENPYQEEDV